MAKLDSLFISRNAEGKWDEIRISVLYWDIIVYREDYGPMRHKIQELYDGQWSVAHKEGTNPVVEFNGRVFKYTEIHNSNIDLSWIR